MNKMGARDTIEVSGEAYALYAILMSAEVFFTISACSCIFSGSTDANHYVVCLLALASGAACVYRWNSPRLNHIPTTPLGATVYAVAMVAFTCVLIAMQADCYRMILSRSVSEPLVDRIPYYLLRLTVLGSSAWVIENV